MPARTSISIVLYQLALAHGIYVYMDDAGAGANCEALDTGCSTILSLAECKVANKYVEDAGTGSGIYLPNKDWPPVQVGSVIHPPGCSWNKVHKELYWNEFVYADHASGAFKECGPDEHGDLVCLCDCPDRTAGPSAPTATLTPTNALVPTPPPTKFPTASPTSPTTIAPSPQISPAWRLSPFGV